MLFTRLMSPSIVLAFGIWALFLTGAPAAEQAGAETVPQDGKQENVILGYVSVAGGSMELMDEFSQVTEILAFGTPIRVECPEKGKRAKVTVTGGLLKGKTGYTSYNSTKKTAFGVSTEDELAERPTKPGEGIVVSSWAGVWNKNPNLEDSKDHVIRYKKGTKVKILEAPFERTGSPHEKFVKIGVPSKEGQVYMTGWIQLHRIYANEMDKADSETTGELAYTLGYMAETSGVPVVGEEVVVKAKFDKIPDGYSFVKGEVTIQEVLDGASAGDSSTSDKATETKDGKWDSNNYNCTVSFAPEKEGTFTVKVTLTFTKGGENIEAKCSNKEDSTLTLKVDPLVSIDEIVHTKLRDESKHKPGERVGYSGYYIDKVVNIGNGLYFIGYVKWQHNEDGEPFKNDEKNLPIEVLLVFRDTDAHLKWGAIVDAWTNSRLSGVADNQYKTARKEIFGDGNRKSDWIEPLYNGEKAAKSNVRTAGYSLGGALAQWFAVEWTADKKFGLKQIDLFQAAGIRDKEAGRFNADRCGQVNISVLAGDIVSLSGAYIRDSEVDLYFSHDILPESVHGIYNFSKEATGAPYNEKPREKYTDPTFKKGEDTQIQSVLMVERMTTAEFNKPGFDYHTALKKSKLYGGLENKNKTVEAEWRFEVPRVGAEIVRKGQGFILVGIVMAAKNIRRDVKIFTDKPEHTYNSLRYPHKQKDTAKATPESSNLTSEGNIEPTN